MIEFSGRLFLGYRFQAGAPRRQEIPITPDEPGEGQAGTPDTSDVVEDLATGSSCAWGWVVVSGGV